MKRTIMFMELDEALALVREGALEDTIRRLRARHGLAGATLFFDVIRLGPEERATLDEAHRCGVALVAVSPRTYLREPREQDASALEAFIANEVVAYHARHAVLPESYGDETPLVRILRELRIEVSFGPRSLLKSSRRQCEGPGVASNVVLI